MVVRRGIIAVLVFVVLCAVGAALAASAVHLVPTAVHDALTTDQYVALTWGARILLVLAGIWLLIGMVAARTRLVRRPGAAAARAAWLGATRPWRARESTLGFLGLDRWLIVLIPVGLLVATLALLGAALSWEFAGLIFVGWLLFALLARLFVGGRSPWPVISAVGGVVVLSCAVTLLVLAVTGPAGYAALLDDAPWLRAAYGGVSIGLFAWTFVAAGWTLSTQLGTVRAVGVVLVSVGGALLVPALAVVISGLVRA